jgi:small neutral amino acid transporter SnatA (MarC family)
MTEFLNSITLLLILLNPFLVIIYLLELVQTLNVKVFSKVLVRGSLIAVGIFVFFALLGDVVFKDLLHAEFASFQIFGGIVFLVIGINFMLKGNLAIEALRGPPEFAAAPIAMPILVGPATVSASVIIGETLDPIIAVMAILMSVGLSIVVIIFLKVLHDWVKPRNEILVQRYTEIAGRVLAIIVGIYAIEMIMQGAAVWMRRIADVM